MDWKASLDTTFSDIWKGSNLRRLLALWVVSLAALTLYGTTTHSLLVPKISPSNELSSPYIKEIDLKNYPPTLHELKSSVGPWSNLIEITEATIPTFKAISQITQTYTRHFGRITYALDVSTDVQNPSTM